MQSDFSGASPGDWDRLAMQNDREICGGLYPLSSAPEKAIFAAARNLIRTSPGNTLAEIGCGAARFLPHLAQELRLVPAGVDFSPAGLAQTHRMLGSVGLDNSRIEYGDLHEFCVKHADAFDAVVSFGLIEHFADLAEILRLHLLCTRAGGRVFVSAPNLSRLNLYWLRGVAPSLLTWHHEISADRVVRAFESLDAAEISSVHLGGPRLFASPEPTSCGRMLFIGASLGRRVFNGAGEGLFRVSGKLATSLARGALSPYFGVACTKRPSE